MIVVPLALKRVSCLLVLLLAFAHTASAGGTQANVPFLSTHPLLEALLQDPTQKTETAFWQAVEKTGTPLVSNSAASSGLIDMTFVWRGDTTTQSVELISPRRSADRRINLMTHIKGTHVWVKTVPVTPDTAFSYVFAPNTEDLIGTKGYFDGLMAAAALDPFNKHPQTMTESRFPFSSLAYGPTAQRPYWSVTKAGVAKGSVTEKPFTSSILNIDRQISIYQPAEAVPGDNLPLVFIFDGAKYLRDANSNAALDNLIAENKIPPVVAIFVHNTEPTTRGEELPCTPNFTNFLADELLPWVKSDIPSVRRSTDIIVAGSSYGGLASACANLFRPEVFNHVLSQSGSYWWYPKTDNSLSDGEEAGWVIRQFASHECHNARYYFDAGSLEWGADLGSIGNSSDALAKLIKSKGCPVTKQTFPGGHDLHFWRETLADGLIALLGDHPSLSH